MEGTSHKGIVVGSVAQDNKLGTTDGHTLLGLLSSLTHNVAHKTHGIHIDTSLCRTDINRATNKVGLGKRLRNRAYHKFIAMSHSLGNDSRITTKKVHAYSLGCTVESACKLHIVVGCLAGITTHKSNRSNGDALVDDRHTKLLRNLLACAYKILGKACNLVVYIIA